MNSTIRKLYTFKKKQKSFDKTFGAKYILDLLDQVRKIEFSQVSDICKTEEDIDLDDLQINELNQIDDSQQVSDSQQENNQIQNVQHESKIEDDINTFDLISPRKKLFTYDSDNYVLIYRIKQKGNKYQLFPCKVSKRTFQMTQQDKLLEIQFDNLEIELHQPNELDFLIPFNSFYQRINELVLSQL